MGNLKSDAPFTVRNRTFRILTIGCVLFILLVSGCTRFKVDNYNSYLYGRIKLGNTLTDLQAKVLNGVPTNLPQTLPIVSGKIYVPDFEQSLLKVFSADGEIKFILGTLKEKPNDKYKLIPAKFGRIGLVAVNSDEEIYVQSRIGKEEQPKSDPNAEDIFLKKSGSFDTEIKDAIPSSILHFSDAGKLLNTINVEGISGTTPFGYIERIETGDDDLLFVFHKSNGEMKLSVYDKGILIRSIGASDFQSVVVDSENVQTRLETILPHSEGKYVVASFSLFDKKNSRFKSRKILKYELETKNVTSLKDVQDPSESLYWILKDNNFFIWETETEEESSIRLQVHDDEGNHVNNIRLNYLPPRGLWRETWMDASDEIYSARIKSGYLEIHKWK
ncbi:hypothetical protein EHQ12_03205 [Leptospira gomenensis]|uniref:Lipoprotein n=1 Tax=Leptospira gomenensis TaxID=2484974 RepID=A0A5F1Z0Y6_9LEPT|nr:hypothetical protein [Leptospira gomenensis]TGK31152.1 hypothetical protein EHQ17_15240 [Leptospira gomenensis]TGK43394.1 hypothetical protein EHQ12_03205 [Leptospira gomenensis]TGK45412.1 hypothetical protein EHQ07_09760 [Leptospira gomenensis]TGK66279.1 hypothetical protein EHQ13_03495 [Leptospira gomenensis]